MLNTASTTHKKHYENFPVASVLLPRAFWPATHALYQFARFADDVADEGSASAVERLAVLNKLDGDLVLLAQNPAHSDVHPYVLALAPHIASGVTPVAELRALLAAFVQDVTVDIKQDSDQTTRLNQTLASLLAYCANSANPVGRMMLRITQSPTTPEVFTYSDTICTALQLINFWQDVGKDAGTITGYVPQTPRRYIPEDMWAKHGKPVDEKSAQWQALMGELCADARRRMLAGAPLLAHLSGRFQWEIALTMAGGLQILHKIEHIAYRVQTQRPVIRWWDAPRYVWTAWQLVRLSKGLQTHMLAK